MSAERFLNSYHNASTPPGPDVPAELAAFMLAVDPVLAQAAELARVLARAHQGAATQLIGEDWSHARKYFSLSEKYAAWADYQQPAAGYGIHAYAHKVRRPGLAGGRHPVGPLLERGREGAPGPSQHLLLLEGRAPSAPELNARTSGVYLRADPSDLQVLDGGSGEERAQLIAQRLQDWKSAANAF